MDGAQRADDAVADNVLAPGEVLGVYPNPAAPGNVHVLFRLNSETGVGATKRLILFQQ